TNNRSGRGKSRRNAAAPIQGKPQKKTVPMNSERGQGQLRAGTGNGSASGSAQERERKTSERGRGSRRSSGGGRSQDASNRNRVSAERTDLPVQKNDEAVMDIIGMNHDCEGVGRVEGFTLFVPGALPGEKVRIKVLKTKKQYGYAKLLDIVQASPDRIAAPCAIYDQCGGCQIQHMSY
ncbi:TRAM domain-containing protein, partial [Paenibacillus sp. 28ISP30-2]|nr:TRAM domain-containing protein [Paenibacillus sp. 28ISP30-2]